MADHLLDEGSAFHGFLSSAFKDEKEVLLSDLTNDGSVFCILSLLASQEVALLRSLLADGSVTLRPSVEDFYSRLRSRNYRGRAVGTASLLKKLSSLY
jgi:hypothetical protein